MSVEKPEQQNAPTPDAPTPDAPIDATPPTAAKIGAAQPAPDFMAMINSQAAKGFDVNAIMQMAQQIVASGQSDAFIAQAKAAGITVPATTEQIVAAQAQRPRTTTDDDADADEDEDNEDDETEEDEDDDGEEYDEDEAEDDEEILTGGVLRQGFSNPIAATQMPPGMQSLMNSPIMAQAAAMMGGGGWRYQQAQMFQQAGQYEQAIEAYLDAIDNNPDDPRSYLGMGQCLLVLDRPKDAETFLQKSVELDPNDAQGYIYLGYAAYNQGDLATTLEHFGQAREIEPDNSVAVNNYGYALFLNHRLEDAEAVFIKGGDLGNERAYYNLGLIRFLLGHDADAQQAYADAFELDPRMNEAAGHLDDIDRARDLFPDQKEAIDKAEALVRAEYTDDEDEDGQ